MGALEKHNAWAQCLRLEKGNLEPLLGKVGGKLIVRRELEDG